MASRKGKLGMAHGKQELHKYPFAQLLTPRCLHILYTLPVQRCGRLQDHTLSDPSLAAGPELAVLDAEGCGVKRSAEPAGGR